VHHYGRWWKSKLYGWVWLPGYVRAPAWVVWRVSDNHVGWCQLSPNVKWRGSEGITINDYTIRNKDAEWIFVEKMKFVDEINRTVVVPSNQNKNIVPLSERVLDIRFENGKVINYGPDVADIEKRTRKKINIKKIQLSKERTKSLIGESEVTLFKTDFKKLEIDKTTGKFKRIDKPKKFKKSPKIKKLIKRKKIEHKRRWKKTGGIILEPVYMGFLQ
jgi:hypothetical protein